MKQFIDHDLREDLNEANSGELNEPSTAHEDGLLASEYTYDGQSSSIESLTNSQVEEYAWKSLTAELVSQITSRHS
jgi:hypothetical protein